MKPLKVGEISPDFNYQTPWSSENNNFYESLIGKKTILMFHRFFGCRICQLDITRLIAKYDLIQSQNARVLVVLQTSPEVIKKYDKEEDIPFVYICDPKHDLYKLYGVDTAPVKKEMTLQVKRKLDTAISEGIVKYENNDDELPTQLPACFIIEPNGIVSYVHYGKDSADLPSVENLNELLKKRMKGKVLYEKGTKDNPSFS